MRVQRSPLPLTEGIASGYATSLGKRAGNRKIALRDRPPLLPLVFIPEKYFGKVLTFDVYPGIISSMPDVKADRLEQFGYGQGSF